MIVSCIKVTEQTFKKEKEKRSKTKKQTAITAGIKEKQR